MSDELEALKAKVAKLEADQEALRNAPRYGEPAPLLHHSRLFPESRASAEEVRAATEADAMALARRAMAQPRDEVRPGEGFQEWLKRTGRSQAVPTHSPFFYPIPRGER